jgi:AcrR family transcriptional regulator
MSESSREQILAAAVEVFASEGYDKASIRTVAKRAEVNNPTIYYYFQSKEGLYLEVLRSVMAIHNAHLEAILASHRTGRERLTAILDESIRLVGEMPQLAQLVFGARVQWAQGTEVDRLFADHWPVLVGMISPCLAEELPDDTGGDRLFRLSAVFAILLGGLVQHLLYVEDPGLDLAKMTDELVALFLGPNQATEN